MRSKISPLGQVHLVLSLVLIMVAVAQVTVAETAKPNRVVTIGSAITEIAFALDQQDRIVARDTTSSFPENDLPDIGYMRALSPEGVLSVTPDLIVAIEGAGPPETIDVLQAANVNYVEIPEGYSRDGIVAKIRAVGAALDTPDAAEHLAQTVMADITAAMALADQSAKDQGAPRVLFVLSTQNGRILASGTGTAADSIIRMAGGINAVQGFGGYKPMTDEAVTLAGPDVILMMDRSGQFAMPDDDLFAMPALIPTPAAQNRRVIRMDGTYLLGFGPRTASAIVALTQALYGTPG